MIEESKQRSILKVVFAAISFVVGCVLLLFVGGYVQYRFGMLGLAITEIMLLAIALISTLAARMDFKKVFRIKVSSGFEWLGSLLIFAGAYFAQYGITYILIYFFPTEITSSSTYINEFVVSVNMVLAIIIVSILPGICEEAWHRGFLLSSLSPLVKSVSVRVIIMGVVFGLFHMDPTRFLQTMCLGLALSFVRIKTDNMLVPISLHAFNNLFSVLVAFLLAQAMQALPSDVMSATEQTMQSGVSIVQMIPVVIMAASLSVVFITLGRYVFGVAEKRRKKNEATKTAAATAIVTGTYNLQDAALPDPQNWAPPSNTSQVDIKTAKSLEPSIVDNKRVYLTVSVCGVIAILSFLACIAASFMAL